MDADVSKNKEFNEKLLKNVYILLEKNKQKPLVLTLSN